MSLGKKRHDDQTEAARAEHQPAMQAGAAQLVCVVLLSCRHRREQTGDDERD